MVERRNMSPLKPNNSKIKDLNNNEEIEILNNDFKRTMTRIINEIKEMYKQPKVFKEHTNKQLTEIRIQTNS
jgi:hypothetical protein